MFRSVFWAAAWLLFQAAGFQGGAPSPDEAMKAFAAPSLYACEPTGDQPGRFQIRAEIRLASGFFDVSSVRPDSVRLEPEGTGRSGWPPRKVDLDGGVARLLFDPGPAAGVSRCPDSLALSGEAGKPARRWRVAFQPSVLKDDQLKRETLALIARFDEHPPEVVELGTPRLGPNPVVEEVVRRGMLAWPALLETLRSEPSKIQVAYAVRCAGRLSGREVKTELRRLRSKIKNVPNAAALDYTILGEIAHALSEESP